MPLQAPSLPLYDALVAISKTALCSLKTIQYLYPYSCCSLPDAYRPVKCDPFSGSLLPRKEVIQPHLPIRLPCYDFTPVIGLTFNGCLLKKVGSPASGAPNSHGVTGGVYKARERIHRDMLIRDY